MFTFSLGVQNLSFVFVLGLIFVLQLFVYVAVTKEFTDNLFSDHLFSVITPSLLSTKILYIWTTTGFSKPVHYFECNIFRLFEQLYRLFRIYCKFLIVPARVNNRIIYSWYQCVLLLFSQSILFFS